ncbi:MAG TPA: hypothetical protein VHE53_04900 [Patescibacteria group bacterium]|nr:hypothetical protein [Patescibacteria group bacterium]
MDPTWCGIVEGNTLVRIRSKVGVAAIVAALLVAFGAFGLGSTTTSAASDPHIGGLVVDAPLSATNVNVSGLTNSAVPVDSRLDSLGLSASSLSGISPVTVTGGMSFLLPDVTVTTFDHAVIPLTSRGTGLADSMSNIGNIADGTNLNIATNNTVRDCALICVGPPASTKVAASPNAFCAAVNCTTVSGLNILGPTAGSGFTRPDGTSFGSLPSKMGGSAWSLLTDNGFRPLDRATPTWLSPTGVDGQQVPALNVPRPTTTDNGPAVLPRASADAPGSSFPLDVGNPVANALLTALLVILVVGAILAFSSELTPDPNEAHKSRNSRFKARKFGPETLAPRPPTFGTLSTS